MSEYHRDRSVGVGGWKTLRFRLPIRKAKRVVRYYFDVREGDCVTTDDVGLDLLNRESALLEAARTIAELARDEIPKHLSGHKIVISARDTAGPILSVSVTFEAALVGSPAAGAEAPKATAPSAEEVIRLLEAFSVADPKTKAEIVAVAEQYASKSPSFAAELLKLKTKH